jgi:small subunit ribosomal protein S4
LARDIEPVCRVCRREKLKLYLKGERCYTEKCAVDRRAYAPGQHGQHGQFRGKMSDYALRLREKQKVKAIYGMLEQQFSNFAGRAQRIKGVTGFNLLVLLESRLDNIVFKMGFATSRNSARQLVRHAHVLVNGKKVNIPSYIVTIGDVVEVKEKTKKSTSIKHAIETVDARGGIPRWLDVNREQFRGVITDLPKREELSMPIQEQLIVEFYSR